MPYCWTNDAVRMKRSEFRKVFLKTLVYSRAPTSGVSMWRVYPKKSFFFWVIGNPKAEGISLIKNPI